MAKSQIKSNIVGYRMGDVIGWTISAAVVLFLIFAIFLPKLAVAQMAVNYKTWSIAELIALAGYPFLPHILAGMAFIVFERKFSAFLIDRNIAPYIYYFAIFGSVGCLVQIYCQFNYDLWDDGLFGIAINANGILFRGCVILFFWFGGTFVLSLIFSLIWLVSDFGSSGFFYKISRFFCIVGLVFCPPVVFMVIGFLGKWGLI